MGPNDASFEIILKKVFSNARIIVLEYAHCKTFPCVMNKARTRAKYERFLAHIYSEVKVYTLFFIRTSSFRLRLGCS